MSIFHSDNPTTSFGYPHAYTNPLKSPNDHLNNTLTLDANFTQRERWILDNDAILAEPSYVDRLLGLHDPIEDEISRTLAGNNDSRFFLGGRSHEHLRHLCRQVLVQRIPEVGIRYWDATIFLANLLFLLFLVAKLVYFRRTKVKYFNRMSGNSTLKQFFVLLFILTLLSLAHTIGSTALSLTNQIGSLVDSIVWFALKFCMFTIELCILFFGFCFGQTSSLRTICCGLSISLLFSVIHSAFQSTFDFRLWDEYVNRDFLRPYGYEEVNFWVASSAVIATVYLLLGFFQILCCRHSLCILHRCPVFAYCLIMSILNYLQAFGALLIRMDCPDGLCVSDLVTLAYFTLYGPLVYFLFLRASMRPEKARLFSYRTHKNDPGSEANGYYPRFSGLISPSYDDLFDYDRIMQHDNTHLENILHLNYDFYHSASHHNNNNSHTIPLMATSATPDSTLTTAHADSETNNAESTSSESRPIIRAPYASGTSSFNYAGGSSAQNHNAYSQQPSRQNLRPKNLAIRPDGQLTFSTISSSSITE